MTRKSDDSGELVRFAGGQIMDPPRIPATAHKETISMSTHVQNVEAAGAILNDRRRVTFAIEKAGTEDRQTIERALSFIEGAPTYKDSDTVAFAVLPTDQAAAITAAAAVVMKLATGPKPAVLADLPPEQQEVFAKLGVTPEAYARYGNVDTAADLASFGDTAPRRTLAELLTEGKAVGRMDSKEFAIWSKALAMVQKTAETLQNTPHIGNFTIPEQETINAALKIVRKYVDSPAEASA